MSHPYRDSRRPPGPRCPLQQWAESGRGPSRVVDHPPETPSIPPKTPWREKNFTVGLSEETQSPFPLGRSLEACRRRWSCRIEAMEATPPLKVSSSASEKD